MTSLSSSSSGKGRPLAKDKNQAFDCDTYSPYSGKFGVDYGSGDDSYTKWHKSTGVCKLPIRNLTIIATSRLENDSFWKGVSNFDLNFMKRYDPNLLAGFWSESYTIYGQAAWNTTMDKIYNRIQKQIKASDQYGIRNLSLSAFDIYDTHVAA